MRLNCHFAWICTHAWYFWSATTPEKVIGRLKLSPCIFISRSETCTQMLRERHYASMSIGQRYQPSKLPVTSDRTNIPSQFIIVVFVTFLLTYHFNRHPSLHRWSSRVHFTRYVEHFLFSETNNRIKRDCIYSSTQQLLIEHIALADHKTC